MLAEKVAKGELPPVDERVPEEPLVIEPYESIGQYGGTLTFGGPSTNIYAYEGVHVIGWVNWLRISKDTGSGNPNVVKGYEISDDLTQVTCFMRKGLKWSDGTPLTSEA
ncbi:MAG: ABC transporter substrate-binding protein, partial [Anaerolineae bacterium]